MGILTIDLEEWFHLLDCESTSQDKWEGYPSRVHAETERLLALLDRHGVKATFFVLGWVADHQPGLIREIAAAGHELGTHSHGHHMVHAQTPAEFRADLRQSIRAIEDAAGVRMNSYRAPGFSITPGEFWAFEILLEEGIENDSSVFPGARAHGGFSAGRWDRPFLIEGRAGNLLREFPITTGGLGFLRLAFAGGGYFRLLPFGVIRRLALEAPYLMTYFHPRDFDPHQPLLPGLSYVRRFRSYVGLGSAFAKLDRLLSVRAFTSLGEAAKAVDWPTSPRLSLGG